MFQLLQIWKAVLRHPYTQLRLHDVAGRVLLGVSLWLLGLGIYHSFYVGINLTELLPVWLERGLIWGYGIIALAGVWAVMVALRSRHGFATYLETRFNLGFKWYNELDQVRRQGQHFWHTPAARVRGIFKHVAIWRALWQRTGLWLVSGWMMALLIAMVQLSLPALTAKVLNNAQAVFWAHTYQYTLTYAERIDQGNPWTVHYAGDYETAVFYAQQHERLFTLSNGASRTLSNLEYNSTFTVVLNKGRVRLQQEVTVTVTEPPVLTAVKVKVTHLPTGRTITSHGVRRILVDNPSRVDLELHYRTNDALAAAQVTSGALPSAPTPNVSAAPARALEHNLSAVQQTEHPYIVTLSTVIRTTSYLNILATNIYGQRSENDELKFIVRENLPPTLTLEAPPPTLALFSLQDVPVRFTLQDDIALQTFKLDVRASTREGQVLWETTLTYPAARLQGKTLLRDTLTLPLTQQHFPTGTQFRYQATVTDYAGLTTRSPEQFIVYLPQSAFIRQNEQQSTALQKSLTLQAESIDNLSKEYERLELLSEKKQLAQKDLQRFEENAARLNEALAGERKQLADLETSLAQQTPLTPVLQKKLTKLKAALDELDGDLLNKLTAQSQKLLTNFTSNVSAAELLAEIKKLDVTTLEQRIDQTLKLLARVKIFQELSNLKELAQNLYERFRDLEGYMSYGELNDDTITAEAQELQNELSYLREQFNKIAEHLPADPQVTRFKQNIQAQLSPAQLAAFSRLAAERSNTAFISERREQLDQLRKNLAALTHAAGAEEIAIALTELNYQIFTLSEQHAALTRLLAGERYPKRYLSESLLRSLLAKVSSAQKALLKHFKTKLELSDNGGLWEPAVWQVYDDAIEHLVQLQRAIDPAAQLRSTQKVHARAEMLKLIKSNNELAALLITIKQSLLQEQEALQLQNSLANAAARQGGLNQRLNSWLEQQPQRAAGERSEQEEAYWRSLLAEQAYLRHLLEQLAANTNGQEGSGQQQQGGSQSSTGEAAASESAGASGGGQPSGTEGSGDGEQGSGSGEGTAAEQSARDGTQAGSDGQQGQGANGEGDGEGNGNGDGEGLPTQSSLQQLAERMRELEAELIKRNPELARVKALQALIEQNLLKHSTGLQDAPTEDTERDNDREAEHEFTTYQSQETTAVARTQLYLLDERLTQLQEKNVYPQEYRAKIAAFLRALRQSLTHFATDAHTPAD